MATANRPAKNGLLGFDARDLRRAIATLKAGLPFGSLTRFQKVSGLPINDVLRVVQIPPRTLARRKAQKRLTPAESERLLRLSLMFEKAVDLFEGNTDAARRWLQHPARALGRITPLAAAETEVGAREVEDLIGRLNHGVFS
jgi:putative toxin-antitoxin system antitoxin component (TIGR02293 family)